MKLRDIAAFAIWVALTVPVTAQNFDVGMAAWDVGDYATAFENWRPLAEQGNAEAQRTLGTMYKTGLGVLQDYAEAMRWFRLAAERGHTLAQTAIGSMYRDGQGVLQDYAEAMRWYRRAADQGDAAAQTLLGIYYFTGQGVPQNLVLGHMWLNIASANGLDQARETRDILEEQMTHEQIVDAQARAQGCLSSGYQDCD